MTKVLMAVTGASAWTLANGSQHPTGFWAEELIAPHRIFNDAGWQVDIATPGAVKPVVDQNSLLPEYTGGSEAGIAELKAYLEQIDGELSSPLALESVDPAGYDILFAPGGHGPMEDLSASPAMGALILAMLDADKPVAAVCHASAALLSADRPDGSWAFDGYRLTGFTNAEEEAIGLAPLAPWLLETRLRERGGQFESGGLWMPHIVSDRNLHTGQNPASSGPLAASLVGLVTGTGTLTGHCLCGNVTYTAESVPLVTAICHCTTCQRQTGSTYSLVVAVPRASVSIEGSTLATFNTTTESTGTPARRQFCSNCGSPLLTLADAAPDLAFIKAGTLDNNTALTPALEVHCASGLSYATSDPGGRAQFPADLPAA